jgi:chromosome partitioning protein
MGKILAIANRRGRVGKTTTSINLAVAFANSGRKTLLVDLDAAGSCAKGLGLEHQETVNDVFNDFKNRMPLKRSILKSNIKGLDFIPIKKLPYLDELRVGEVSPNEQILRGLLHQGALGYDHIVIDCPPHLSGNINAGFIAADSVLIPVAPGKFSFAAVRKILSQINDIRENYNPELKIAGIFLTNYEFNNGDSFTLKKELFKDYPKLVLNTSIPKSSAVQKAFESRVPLLIFKPDDRASKAYLKLADELFERKNLFSLKRKV